MNRALSLCLILTLVLSGCGKKAGPNPPPADASADIIYIESNATPTVPPGTPSPAPRLRYLFLFIGDGMGPNQVQAVNDVLFLNGERLSFPDFPVHGQLLTNNILGKTTDSAAAATALSTGQKTENGRLGQDQDGLRLAALPERLAPYGYRTGILTTVSLDHATPGGFYAHTDARTNYDAITAQLFESGIPYFAGGGFHSTGLSLIHI